MTVTLDPAEVILILPALDEEAHIEACLRSLMVPADWMSRVTTVVADGGSTDATRQIVRDLSREMPNLVLVDNPRKLQSAGINEAVSTVANPAHRVMVRCDVHAVYPSGYVRDVAEAVAERGVASVVTAMDAVGPSPVQRAFAWIVDTPLGSGGAAHRGGQTSGDVDHGHHAGFDLGWFRHIGGYDPTFSHNEDAEYDARLARAGGRIWLEAGIRMDYVMRPTLAGLSRQYWNYGRGRARTIAKHRVTPRVRQLIPVLNVVFLALSLLVGIAWPWALMGWALYLSLLGTASAACAMRLRSAAGLMAGPALAAMHLSWGAGFLWQTAQRTPARNRTSTTALQLFPTAPQLGCPQRSGTG